MGFDLSNWLLRKKFGAQIRTSGRAVEHHRVGNPFHAVSIEPGAKACAEARKVESQRFLASNPPMLPLRDCDLKTCQCRYIHYNDRRILRDRRVNFANPHAHRMSDRRSTGRRMTD